MWIRAIAVIAACALSGCAGISGSSSMRVEVEVYKGPLSLARTIHERAVWSRRPLDSQWIF